MTTAPAILAKMARWSLRKVPMAVAEAPRAMNTVENPRTKMMERSATRRARAASRRRATRSLTLAPDMKDR